MMAGITDINPKIIAIIKTNANMKDKIALG